MSETDKYVAIVANLPTRLGFKGEDARTAAYLREHFVTREEYDRLSGWMETTPTLQLCRMNDQIATLTAERDRLRAALEEIRNEDSHLGHPCDGPVYGYVGRIADQALNPEQPK